MLVWKCLKVFAVRKKGVYSMWREIRKGYRRLVAFLLTAVIVGTNVLGNAGVAFAAGMSESALFLVEGTQGGVPVFIVGTGSRQEKHQE